MTNEQLKEATDQYVGEAFSRLVDVYQRLDFPVEEAIPIMVLSVIERAHRYTSSLSLVAERQFKDIADRLHDDAVQKLNQSLMTDDELRVTKRKPLDPLQKLLAELGLNIEGVQVMTIDEFLDNEIGKKD
jgi:hypothetical protein